MSDADQNFTAAEREAMKARASEVRAARSKAAKKTPEEAAQEVLDKIAEMTDADRELAEKIHAMVTSAAPHLEVSTYYGMPAYKKNGKVICFFKPAAKFKDRYATFGFETMAQLDDGNVWATGFSIRKLDDADLEFLAGLVTRAAS
ncbi:iron chaperone [Microbacterium sp. XT11]|uniref:iron chaperone n=1 Tax=Microbacterium sp. XT11 TaxID=367477 RepID=UPI000742D3F4|nr:DUF1801 domain-containing protein [Microbacterium sp. XT11]ALX66021.1 hypothetical protein AB663_000877 [Microbacterium sp. XT11]